MNIQFLTYTFDADEKLTEMIFDLYSADDGMERMTHEKIKSTITHYKNNALGGMIYLFYKNADIAGYAIVNNFWSNEYGGYVAFLDELFVCAVYRSEGIGTAFLNFLETNEKYKSIFLEVYPENKIAYDFYKRHGFKISKSDLLKKDLSSSHKKS